MQNLFAELFGGTLVPHVNGLCMNARLKIQTNLKLCWHANETTGSAEFSTDPDSLIHLVTLYTKYTPSFRGKPLTSGHITGYAVSIWQSNISDLP